MMWRMAKPYLPGALAAVAMLAVIYRLAVGRVRKWFESAREHIADGASPSRNPGLIYVVAAFLLLGLLGLVTVGPDKAEGQAALRLAQTSPVWKRAMAKTLKPEDFLRTARSLGLGELNATVSAPVSPKSDLNVVLVFMESSYNKHLSLFGGSEETQPLLSKYATAWSSIRISFRVLPPRSMRASPHSPRFTPFETITHSRWNMCR